MRILAIESSCDETAAAVIEDGRKMLSNVVDTQIATHALYGGVVPEIASRRHMEAVVRVTEQALADAEMDKHEVDAVAATCAPGLIGALLVGANFGKSLAFAMNKPFIPVHHIRGHISFFSVSLIRFSSPYLLFQPIQHTRAAITGYFHINPTALTTLQIHVSRF